MSYDPPAKHAFNACKDSIYECVICGLHRGHSTHHFEPKAETHPVESPCQPPALSMIPPTESLEERARRRESENRMRALWQDEPHAFEFDGHVDEQRADRPCAKCGLLVEADVHHGQRASDKTVVSASTVLPDTGLRETLVPGGAVREADPSKPLIGCISPVAKRALGRLMAKAEDKYKAHGGCRNWEKGMPVTRVIESIERHIADFQMRDEKEDHLAAIMWNAMVLIHYRDAGTTTGLSWAELDDRPVWFARPK